VLTDVGFLLSLDFVWKVLVATSISCIPLFILKYLRWRFAPPSYSKLSWNILYIHCFSLLKTDSAINYSTGAFLVIRGILVQLCIYPSIMLFFVDYLCKKLLAICMCLFWQLLKFIGFSCCEVIFNEYWLFYLAKASHTVAIRLRKNKKMNVLKHVA